MAQTKLIQEIQSRNTELSTRLEAIIHNTPIYIMSFDKDGIYTYADGNNYRKDGVRISELVGQSIFERYKDSPDVLAQVSRALKGEEVKAELSFGGYWYLYTSFPVYDDNKEVASVLSIAFDITDRVAADKIIKDNQMRLETVLNHAPIILWGTDINGIVTFSEGKGLAAIGAQPGSLVGKSVFDIYKDRPDSLECLKIALSGGSITREVQSGNIYFDTHYSALRNDQGDVIGMVGLSTDVTARKLSEIERAHAIAAEATAKEASALKSRFLATMSHEIRTPINGVIGMTSFLLDTELTAEQRIYADAVRTSADTLLALVNDILDLSKAEAGKIELEIINFDLKHLINSVEKIMAFPITTKGIGFQKNISANLPLEVKGDPTRIRQVLINLVNNAVKFTERGLITISVGLEHNHLRFDVTDTGIGIPEIMIGQVFQAFTQADSTTTRKYGGSGLGLSICRHLVELMGGKIGVVSQTGKGSTFWFTVPFEAVGASTSEESNSPPPLSTLRPLTILVAEDNAINQIIAVKMLEKLGHKAVLAANGLEAINALNEEAFDLVLMDCQMPELDGYEATKYIRSEPSLPYQAIPIIAMTANAVSGDREKCMGAGMNNYLSKPMRIRDVAEVLEQIAMAFPELKFLNK